MTALTPPPEHAGIRWHVVDTGDREPEPIVWDDDNRLWRSMDFPEVSPEEAYESGWEYLRPFDPDTIPLPDVETIARALAKLDRRDPDSPTADPVIPGVDHPVKCWMRYRSRAERLLAAISGERK